MTDSTPEQLGFEADLDRLRAHFGISRLDNDSEDDE